MSPDVGVTDEFDLEHGQINAVEAFVLLLHKNPERQRFVTGDDGRVGESCVD
jgi:hypothetical protein